MSQVMLSVLTSSFFSNNLSADNQACFDINADHEQNMVLDVQEDHVRILVAADGNLQGRTYPREDVFDGSYHYDLDTYRGGAAKLVVEQALAQGLKARGFAKIRSISDTGALTVRFLCKDSSQGSKITQ